MSDGKVKKTREEVLRDIELAHRKRVAQANELLTNLKSRKDDIERKLERFQREEPDLVYRFYHQSYKFFILNNLTQQAVEFFEDVAPESSTLNEWFRGIADDGLSKEFDWDKTNPIWLTETLPVLQAYWHSKYFLEQMLVAANELENAPEILPSGWAAVLYLYDLR